MPTLDYRLRLASFLLLGPGLWAADPYIAVIEKVAGAVSFYGESGEELGRVKVGAFPHEAALSPNGRTLYVSNNGVLWMTEDAQGTNTISVVDVPGRKKLHDIDLGRFHRPHGIAVVPGSGQVLATTERPFGLILVDPKSRKILRDFDVKGKSPHMVIPSKTGDVAFASNTDSSNVAAIHLKSGQTKLITTGSHPQGGVLSPNGETLYLVNAEANQIVLINVKSQEVTGKIATGKGPARIAITPDGKTLVYNLGMEPAIGFADVASGKQVAKVPVSGRPMSLTLSRDGRRAFTGIQDQDKVVFVSVPERKIEKVIQMPKGRGPDPVIPLR